ncbi:hypothetical protein D7241_11990 [Stutzerimonas sp. VN223-3]|uniref:hypothetical protein n=1 Tax=Stutzerimonas sp. VN223-3 TaxID=3384601 RepID=UPI0038B5665A
MITLHSPADLDLLRESIDLECKLAAGRDGKGALLENAVGSSFGYWPSNSEHLRGSSEHLRDSSEYLAGSSEHLREGSSTHLPNSSTHLADSSTHTLHWLPE